MASDCHHLFLWYNYISEDLKKKKMGNEFYLINTLLYVSTYASISKLKSAVGCLETLICALSLLFHLKFRKPCSFFRCGNIGSLRILFCSLNDLAISLNSRVTQASSILGYRSFCYCRNQALCGLWKLILVEIKCPKWQLTYRSER